MAKYSCLASDNRLYEINAVDEADLRSKLAQNWVKATINGLIGNVRGSAIVAYEDQDADAKRAQFVKDMKL